jgi:hypothetical protein
MAKQTYGGWFRRQQAAKREEHERELERFKRDLHKIDRLTDKLRDRDEIIKIQRTMLEEMFVICHELAKMLDESQKE